MRPSFDGFLRWLSSLVVRGPEAPFVLGDLNETLRRDLSRGVRPLRARGRYLANVLMSSLSLGRARFRRLAAVSAPGVSFLDVKLGWRMLRKHPLLTAVSITSLAVGIPVGLAPAHMVEALQADLPVEDGDRIRGLRYFRGAGDSDAVTGYYDFTLLRDELTTFEDLAAVRFGEYNLDPGEGSGAPVAAAAVTASAFSVLRARPLLGRALDLGDEVPNGAPVVVLGYDVWQARLAGDPEVLETTVRIAGVPHAVVGVMPPGFYFPARHQMWLPLREQAIGEPGKGPALTVFGRLADGATPEMAQAELTAVGQRLATDLPATYDRLRPEVVPYAMQFFGLPKDGMLSEPDMRIFQLFMVFVLVVACVNVGLLIFARTATRAEELAVRSALGASRARIVAQVFTEALVMAVVAAGLGLLLIAVLANRLLGAMWVPDWGGLPYWVDMGVTQGTVVKALVLAVFSAAVAAVAPALRVTGRRVQRSIQEARARGYGIGFGITSTILVATDIALAVAVVGLAVGIGDRMIDVSDPPGLADFDATEYLAVEIRLRDAPVTGGADPTPVSARTGQWAETQRALVGRLKAEPRVRGVAVASALPRMDHRATRFEVEGAPADRAPSHMAETVQVDIGFFDALEQPVLMGRGFSAADLEGDRTAVIVNTTFAERTLGGVNPVGRRIRPVSTQNGDPVPWLEIVGVVPDLGVNIVEPEEGLGVYYPAAPGELNPFRLAIHVGSDPASFAAPLRELVSAVEPTAIVVRPMALDRVFPEDWYLMIGMMIGWSLFVAVLVALAASGIYAIMAFTVAQRTREIGIRAALGARPGQVVTAIGRRAAVQLALGALLGMPAAGRLYFMIREDPTATGASVLVAVAPGVAVMLLVGLLACTVPLKRALRIMPTEAMRGVG